MRLNESLGINLDSYSPVDMSEYTRKGQTMGGGSLEPNYNPMLRCPLPPISVPPDSLRQFYLDGQIPQYRLLPPTIPNTSSTSTTTTAGTTANITGKTPVQPSNNQASVVTGQLNPNSQYQGTLQLIKPSVVVSNISVTAPARIRLYNTQKAQQNDAGRSQTQFPSSTNGSGIILDVVLDSKQSWPVSPPANAVNGDSPQSNNLYITVDSLALSTTVITATLNYN